MALFSENRRHRLHRDELGPVLRAVKAHLSQLLEERKDLYEAESLFKVLYRFVGNKWGRPSYPPVTWQLIGDWVKGPFIQIDQPTEAMFENRNFENMTLYYKAELMKLQNGDRVNELFDPTEKASLRRLGILVFDNRQKNKSAKGRPPLYHVTPRARAILKASPLGEVET